ncbi:MAG: hypothetical protein M3541_19520 [Acidobacteriota bacterium]|nr:hypothetical protein [Acidobacteriota bacterium]MDQ3420929.1 hypothetical protein [Acidobacteriota bacterium]
MSSDLDNRTLGELRLEWKQSITTHGRRPVCWQDLDTLLEDMLKDRMKLERRIKELEGKPALKFTGTYSDAAEHAPGHCTTRAGGLWVCTAKTTGTFDHECWVLAVKRGEAR